MTKRMLQTVCVAAVIGALMIAGCKISNHKNGDDQSVNIQAPGASVHVDTGTTANDSGIPLYPGALAKHSTGDDKSHAHVNVNTPFLKVQVIALTFTSEDAPEKILSFYRTKLGSYGTVVECTGKGQDVELGSGRGLDSPVNCGKEPGHSSETSLKVGTESNQHVVSVKPSGKGSEFELIYVHLGKSKSDDDYGGKQPS